MKKIILALVLALMLAPHAHAELSVTDKTDINAVESSLNHLKTLQGNFTQVAPDGTISSGRFYLSRPGKLRFEFAAPNKDLIVANGHQIFFYDAALKEAQSAPISQTLANFILRDKIAFRDDIRVTGVDRDANSISVTVTQARDPQAGSLSLLFTRDKTGLNLKQWVVKDAQAQKTIITLSELQTGMKLDNQLFSYVPRRLNQR